MLSEETDELKETLHGLGIELKPVMYKMDVRPLLKVVLDQFFGPSVGLVDMITEHIPSPVESAPSKVCLRMVHWLTEEPLTSRSTDPTNISGTDVV